jgi:hypothetical protein
VSEQEAIERLEDDFANHDEEPNFMDLLDSLSNKEFVWRSAAGRHLRMHEIEDTHLCRIERFLLGRARVFELDMPREREVERVWSLRLVQEEMRKRGLDPLPFPETTPSNNHTEKPKRTYSRQEQRHIAKELDYQTYGKLERVRFRGKTLFKE